MMSKIYSTLFAILFCFYGFSQDILTKEEAFKQALTNNLGIQIAKKSSEIAENNASVLNSGYLPSLTGLAGATYNSTNINQVQNSGITTELNGVETDRYNASVNLNYTLFDGLGRWYNYKSLKEQSNLSELEVKETIENTVLQLFSVYYEVARLTENVQVLKEALQISKDRLIRAEYQNEYGQNTGLDILNAEVDVNTDSISVLNAGQLLNNTKRDLNLVMNRDLSTFFRVDTTVIFLASLKMRSVINEARLNNVRMLQVETGLLINNYNAKSIKGNYLPSVGLSGSYGWNKSNNGPASFVTSSTTTGISLGANLTWNLFDGGGTITRVKNAKINFETQELLKQQIEMQVERDIRNAKETYQNALFVFKAQEKNVATNQNNFERTNERYKIGRATSLEFRQAQINLLNAILTKNRAKYTAKLAELQVLQVSGQLLNTEF